MSRKTKRKHVFKEVLEDDLSLPESHQTIVRILSSKGNNLHEVLTPTQGTYLASMPTKFRKNVWVKRGTYVLVEPIEEGDKVKAEIVRILTNEHLKYFKKENVWPCEFDPAKREEEERSEDDLPENVNRIRVEEEDTDSDENSDSSGS